MKTVVSFIVSICAASLVLGMASIIMISCLTSNYSNARLLARINWHEFNTIFETSTVDKRPASEEYAIATSPPGPVFTYYGH